MFESFFKVEEWNRGIKKLGELDELNERLGVPTNSESELKEETIDDTINELPIDTSLKSMDFYVVSNPSQFVAESDAYIELIPEPAVIINDKKLVFEGDNRFAIAKSAYFAKAYNNALNVGFSVEDAYKSAWITLMENNSILFEEARVEKSEGYVSAVGNGWEVDFEGNKNQGIDLATDFVKEFNDQLLRDKSVINCYNSAWKKIGVQELPLNRDGYDELHDEILRRDAFEKVTGKDLDEYSGSEL
ncbi:MAG: hypothetical protein KAQ83_01450 [Nanoarchaeota archaeon]|nr:hypothetical protein [Nanoarchaeota archaeon]